MTTNTPDPAAGDNSASTGQSVPAEAHSQQTTPAAESGVSSGTGEHGHDVRSAGQHSHDPRGTGQHSHQTGATGQPSDPGGDPSQYGSQAGGPQYGQPANNPYQQHQQSAWSGQQNWDSTSQAGPPPNNRHAGALSGLRRSADNKMIAGVCTGLARATNTDPILFRVILAVLVFFGGIGALLYLIAWLLLPADGDSAAPAQALLGNGKSSTNPSLTLVLGVGAVLIGAVTLGQDPATLILIAALGLGVALLLRRGNQPEPPPKAQPASAEVHPGAGTATQYQQPAPAYAGYTVPPATAAPIVPPATYTAPTPTASYAPTTPTASAAFAPHGPYGQPATPPPPRPRKQKHPKSPLGRLTIAAVFAALGGLVIADISGVNIPGPAYLAAGLTVTAIGLLISAFVGRARGLIVLGVILTVVLGTVEASRWVDKNWVFDETHARPQTLAELDNSYDSQTGSIELDLRDLDFSGTQTDLDIDLGVGEVEVIVPDNVNVTGSVDVGTGSIEVFDRASGGLGLSRNADDKGKAGGGELTINIDLGVGNARITRAADAETPKLPRPTPAERQVP